MLRSSLGFHTLTLKKWLLCNEKERLIEDVRKYNLSHPIESIQVYKDKKNPENTIIKFPKYQGIKWVIRSDMLHAQLKSTLDLIEVTINPKFLSGIQDYITAATYDDMDAAVATFDRISTNISPVLGTFADYDLKRIDYCINFSVSELAPDCTSDQIMNLIRRGDIPPSYKEYKQYDKISHRTRASPNSFYLVNKSVTINCYRKGTEIQKRMANGIMREDPDFITETLDEAEDIIRFEVQCKYHNVYARSRRAKANGNKEVNLCEDLLSDETCADIINYYFNKIIGRGLWYSLYAARAQIRSCHFNSQKEKRLIEALELVNRCQSLADSKELLQGKELEAFKRTLKDLSSIGINPVTIPKGWGIGRIWNLLDAYYSKVSEERINKQWDEELF